MIAELIGYSDRISVRAGDTVRFKVSTTAPRYDVALVRLIRGDRSGRGFTEEVVAERGTMPGRQQPSFPGSYGRIEDGPQLSPADGFTILMWIYPTTPARGRVQGLLGKWTAGGVGYALVVGETGDLCLWLGNGGHPARFSSGHALRRRQWYFVAAAFDAADGIVRLEQIPLVNFARDSSIARAEHRSGTAAVARNPAPLLVGATHLEPVADGRHAPRGLYNGKVERPVLVSRALTTAELAMLREGADPRDVAGADLVGDWDFAGGFASARFADRGPHAAGGVLVNMPMRAVTGHGWNADEYDYKHAPGQYGAIHFHDDDLEDCGWQTDFTWQVPGDARSGFYAARLRAGDLEDHIPFFVSARPGRAAAKVAVLAPTFTYLAYANERLTAMAAHAASYTKRPMVKDALDHYLLAHPELAMSIYDVHSDGSGCCYSTHLRPITNMRPKYRQWQVAGPRHLAADLNVVDWLEVKGIGYEVITDHDLHAEGRKLLDDYRVVITGTHPEYWSRRMLDALRGYLDAGGRHMYLGGNGYYWVTGVDPERPHVVEIRRGNAGTRAWNSEPGELYMSTTGELGGLWRHRGIAPNRVAGIGFISMGYDAPTPGYRRQADSFDERAAFIFAGIPADAVIGNFGSVLGGAAGDEIDCVDFDLGTPPHALRLASAEGYGHPYMTVIEEHLEMSPIVVAAEARKIRSDIVYFETPNDGAVFAAGAITWSASLAHDGYDNNVSRITENVLRRFMEP
jgi:N,N-dimethylformamidase